MKTLEIRVVRTQFQGKALPQNMEGHYFSGNTLKECFIKAVDKFPKEKLIFSVCKVFGKPVDQAYDKVPVVSLKDRTKIVDVGYEVPANLKKIANREDRDIGRIPYKDVKFIESELEAIVGVLEARRGTYDDQNYIYVRLDTKHDNDITWKKIEKLLKPFKV